MKQKIKIVKFLKVLENGAESHLYATVSQDVEPIKEGDWGYISIGKNGTIGKISYDKDAETWDLTTLDNIHYPYSSKEYIRKIKVEL